MIKAALINIFYINNKINVYTNNGLNDYVYVKKVKLIMGLPAQYETADRHSDWLAVPYGWGIVILEETTG